MPFTPTHALAAVPMSTIRALDPVGLTIGCMIPDIAMLVPATPSYAATHSWFWGPLCCFPYAVLAYLLFRSWRAEAIALCPAPVRRRLAKYIARPHALSGKGWLMLFVSVSLGVLSHITWDGFTHGGRFGVQAFPVLDETWLRIAGSEIRGYKVLQHGSSLVGLPLLFVIVRRWYGRQPANPDDDADTASG